MALDGNIQHALKNALGKAPASKELKKALEIECFRPYSGQFNVPNQSVSDYMLQRQLCPGRYEGEFWFSIH
jgi:hypothetical protein